MHISIFLLLLLSFACNTPTEPVKTNLDPEFSEYWYNGEAEISSYRLEQARYGEIREGSSVLIFVTEDFSTKSWSKADRPTKKDIPVLKLNNTKSFNTGIYPYSMMTSSFYPVKNSAHSLKVSTSTQEWCGHTYMELRNNKKFEVSTRSYFEGESSEVTLAQTVLEDDIWTQIRINPKSLPMGDLEMIPSFFFIRLLHIPLQGYTCTASKKNLGETTEYQLNYPSLERTLLISYENEFPHKILFWEETYKDGYGANKVELVTKGTLIESIKSDYWTRNSVSDLPLRKKLGLD